VRLLHVTGVGAQAGAVEWSGEALMGVGAAELVAGAHSLHTGEGEPRCHVTTGLVDIDVLISKPKISLTGQGCSTAVNLA
jgi:hypothetical protein